MLLSTNHWLHTVSTSFTTAARYCLVALRSIPPVLEPLNTAPLPLFSCLCAGGWAFVDGLVFLGCEFVDGGGVEVSGPDVETAGLPCTVGPQATTAPTTMAAI